MKCWITKTTWKYPESFTIFNLHFSKPYISGGVGYVSKRMIKIEENELPKGISFSKRRIVELDCEFFKIK